MEASTRIERRAFRSPTGGPEEAGRNLFRSIREERETRGQRCLRQAPTFSGSALTAFRLYRYSNEPVPVVSGRNSYVSSNYSNFLRQNSRQKLPEFASLPTLPSTLNAGKKEPGTPTSEGVAGVG